jgi:type IV secretory pathway TrbL component
VREANLGVDVAEEFALAEGGQVGRGGHHLGEGGGSHVFGEVHLGSAKGHMSRRFRSHTARRREAGVNSKTKEARGGDAGVLREGCTSTGPGRPLVAMWKASRIMRGRSWMLSTEVFHLVQAREIPT